MARASATPPTKIKAQQGTPNQLPQGEATALNDAVTAIPNQGDQAAAPEMTPPEQATPADYQPQYTPQNEEDAFLTDPSLSPEEDVTAGIGATPQDNMPSDVRNALPVFLEAASRPDAPASLKALAQLLQRYS